MNSCADFECKGRFNWKKSFSFNAPPRYGPIWCRLAKVYCQYYSSLFLKGPKPLLRLCKSKISMNFCVGPTSGGGMGSTAGWMLPQDAPQRDGRGGRSRGNLLVTFSIQAKTHKDSQIFWISTFCCVHRQSWGRRSKERDEHLHPTWKRCPMTILQLPADFLAPFEPGLLWRDSFWNVSGNCNAFHSKCKILA